MDSPKILLAAAFAAAILTCSCNKKGVVEDESPVVASVNEHTMTLAQLTPQIPDDASPKDSIQFAKRAMEAWARNKVIFDHAMDNLGDEQASIEAQVEEFRQSLYIHKYEQKLTNSALDFKVNDDAVMAYYKKNKSEMLLGNDIAKANFIKVKKDQLQNNPIKEWIVSRREDDIDNLKNFGYQFASKFSFSDEWLDVRFVFSQMPHKITNEQNVLRNKVLVEDSDSAYFYYLYITEFMSKNDPAPIQYVQSNIEEILLQMKKNKLLQETRNKLYENAKNKNTVKFHDL